MFHDPTPQLAGLVAAWVTALLFGTLFFRSDARFGYPADYVLRNFVRSLECYLPAARGWTKNFRLVLSIGYLWLLYSRGMRSKQDRYYHFPVVQAHDTINYCQHRVFFTLVVFQLLVAAAHMSVCFQQAVYGFTIAVDPLAYFGSTAIPSHIAQTTLYLINVRTNPSHICFVKSQDVVDRICLRMLSWWDSLIDIQSTKTQQAQVWRLYIVWNRNLYLCVPFVSLADEHTRTVIKNEI